MARSTVQLACPRCGYDVSGVVPTWVECCPLVGTCSECGLEFAWVDIFAPGRTYPTWSFEHARRWRLRSLLGTVLRAPFAKSLWGGLRLSNPIRWSRLAALAAIVTITAHLGVAGIVVWFNWGGLVPGGFRLVSGSWVMNARFDWVSAVGLTIWPYVHVEMRLIGPFGIMLVLWNAFTPLAFLVLRDTLAAQRVRRAHLLRAWMYSLVMAGCAVVVDVALIATPMGISMSRWGGMLLPWTTAKVILLAIAVVWLVGWWRVFARTYLQLSRPGRVANTMLTVSLLAALATCLLVDEEMRYAVGTPVNAVVEWLRR